MFSFEKKNGRHNVYMAIIMNQTHIVQLATQYSVKIIKPLSNIILLDRLNHIFCLERDPTSNSLYAVFLQQHGLAAPMLMKSIMYIE